MQHPQARLIPEVLWNTYKFFNCQLDERMLPLMSLSKDELITRLTPSLVASSTKESRKTWWLAIALSHPDLELSMFRRIGHQFELNETELFQLLAIIGNKERMDDFINEGVNLNTEAMIRTDDFSAYRYAASHGHVEVLKHLEAQAPQHIQAMIRTDDFSAYRKAASHGHVEVLKHLEAQAPQHIQVMIRTDYFSAYRKAASHGHVEVLKHLEAQAPQHIQAMIQAGNFSAYCEAASHGHVEVLKHLEAQAPQHIRAIIKKAYDFSAYRKAAAEGHLEVLKHLEAQAPQHIQEMIRKDEFSAYRYAAAQGHIEVLKHLEAQAPQHIQTMIQGWNFSAYQCAAENGHFEIAQRMLSQSNACFAYAEMHVREYASIITPFIQDTLTRLRHEALNVPTHEVFNLNDSEQAKQCFYMIRHFIRLNDRTRDDDVRFLLNIPSVKALAHMEVNGGPSNELIRLAITTDNAEAASILLTLPEVRALAEQNNYYRAQQRGILDLAQLARDRESSMHALTQGEQQRLKEATKEYQPLLDAVGIPHLMDALHDQLIERYEANPASIVTQGGIQRILPMDFADFQKLKLQKEESEKALKAYYQHKDHTAWRYLAKPNPWMNPHASYVYAEGTERWSTFEEYQPLITLLWLAAQDATLSQIDGHTPKTRLEHFIDELAHIGRAHNWDSSRINAQGKEEEYDDLTGDKPSCFSGVKRRLFQSVLGHPLLSILSEEIILHEMRDFVREHFEECLKTSNPIKLKEAFDDYFVNTSDLSDENKLLLASLNFSQEKILSFELYLSKKYGAQYTEDFHFHKLVSDKLRLKLESKESSDYYHALMLDGLVGFYTTLSQYQENSMNDAFDERLPDTLTEHSGSRQNRFFTHLSTEENESDAAKHTQPKNNS